MPDIDKIIHQPIRLRIMASLMTLDNEEKVDFTYLRNLHNLTDGNLGAHLLKLEEAKYIEVEKVFIARKPKTFISITIKGKNAFNDHVEALEKIFTPFFSSKGNKGTGLGLFIANKIVEQHGGKIIVKSTPGHETRFTIRIPKTVQKSFK